MLKEPVVMTRPHSQEYIYFHYGFRRMEVQNGLVVKVWLTHRNNGDYNEVTPYPFVAADYKMLSKVYDSSLYL